MKKHLSTVFVCFGVLLFAIFGIFSRANATTKTATKVLNERPTAAISRLHDQTTYTNPDMLDVLNDIGGDAKRIFILFNPYLPDNAIVSSADLSLYLSDCTGNSDQMTVGQVATEWNWYSIRWFDQPTHSTEVKKNIGCDFNSRVSWDVTQITKNWVEKKEPKYGFVVLGQENIAVHRHFMGIYSSDKPTLTINFSWEPIAPKASNIVVTTTDNSATITWNTDIPVINSAYYDTSAQATNEVYESDLASTSHSVTLSNLTKGQTYYYRFGTWDWDRTDIWENDWTTFIAGQTAAASTSGTNSSTTQSTQSAKIDSSIKSPTLEYVIYGGTKLAAPITGDLSIYADEVIKIGGKSFAGANIVLLMADKTFSGIADKNGNWEIVVDTKDIVAGSYKITAQAQDTGKNKNSEAVDLFTLKIQEKPTDQVAAKSSSDDKKTNTRTQIIQKYLPYILIFLAVVFAGLSILLIVLLKRSKASLSTNDTIKEGQNGEQKLEIRAGENAGGTTTTIGTTTTSGTTQATGAAPAASSGAPATSPSPTIQTPLKK